METQHTIKPPNFEEMTEAEQDQWYVHMAELALDKGINGNAEDRLHALFCVKDYLWYLKK